MACSLVAEVSLSIQCRTEIGVLGGECRLSCTKAGECWHLKERTLSNREMQVWEAVGWLRHSNQGAAEISSHHPCLTVFHRRPTYCLQLDAFYRTGITAIQIFPKDSPRTLDMGWHTAPWACGFGPGPPQEQVMGNQGTSLRKSWACSDTFPTSSYCCSSICRIKGVIFAFNGSWWVLFLQVCLIAFGKYNKLRMLSLKW